MTSVVIWLYMNKNWLIGNNDVSAQLKALLSLEAASQAAESYSVQSWYTELLFSYVIQLSSCSFVAYDCSASVVASKSAKLTGDLEISLGFVPPARSLPPLRMKGCVLDSRNTHGPGVVCMFGWQRFCMYLSHIPVISHGQQSLDWPWPIVRPPATSIH